MRFRSILPVVLPLAIVLTGCQPQVSQLSDENLAAVRAVDDAYVAAVMATDWNGLVALLTPAGVFMPPNETAVEGRAANLRRLQTFDLTSVDYAHTQIDVSGAAGVAYIQGTFSLSMTLTNVEEPLTDSGKYLWVLLKQPTGEWLIDKVIWNTDLSASAQE